MTLSILIVSFNTKGMLEQCLHSIRRHPPSMSYEVFVVDNGSKDGSPALVAERFPEVHLIANSDNRGFAAANNQALSVAKGEVILFLNSDTELLAGSLDLLIRHLDSNQKVGVVGPTERTGDGIPYPTICPFPTLSYLFLTHSGLRHRFYKNRVINPYRRVWEKAQVTGEPTVVDWLSGASLMVRRKVLEEIGFFDERYFFYMEETDLCKRARAAGWLVVFVPTAMIIHHGGQSEGKVREGLLTISCTFGEIYYFRKHRSTFALFLLKGLLFVEFCVKLLITKLNDPRRWAYWEILAAVLGLRLPHITEGDLYRR